MSGSESELFIRRWQLYKYTALKAAQFFLRARVSENELLIFFCDLMIPYSINKTSVYMHALCTNKGGIKGLKRNLSMQALLSRSPDQTHDHHVQERVGFGLVTAGKGAQQQNRGRRLSSMKCSHNVEPVNTAAALPLNGMQQPSIHLQLSRHDMSAPPLRKPVY